MTANSLSAVDADGVAVPIRARTLAERLRAPLAEVGDDVALADALAEAVFAFLARRSAAPPPSLADVDALLEKALVDAGRKRAAEAFARERLRRARLQSELLITPERGRVGAENDGESGSAAEPWDAAAWRRRLMSETDLPPAPAEEVVAATERRLAALGLKVVGAALVREILHAEAAARGLAGDAPDRGFVLLRRDVERAASDMTAPPEALVAGPVFARKELDSAPRELARAHAEGILHIHGLDRPAALERLTLSAGLLPGVGRDAAAASTARALLRVRGRLEQVRPHVAGTIELPDLVGRVASRLAGSDDAAEVADDLLEAVAHEDAFGRPAGPVIELGVPLDGFAPEAGGDRERAVVLALLARCAADPSAFEGVRLVLSTDGGVATDPTFAAKWASIAELLLERQGTALLIRRDAASDPFLRDPESLQARTLLLAPARVAVNLAALLLDAEGRGLKGALPLLDAAGRLALDVFHDRLWRQRSGLPYGVHGLVVLFGGPGSVDASAEGQGADLDVWGLPSALEMLLRRDVIGRAQTAEAAARLLGYLDFLAGEERNGLRLAVRLGGVRAMDVRRRFHAALERMAVAARRSDVVTALKTPRGIGGMLPVVAPLFDGRNRPLLDAPVAGNLGPGLHLPVASLPDGLTLDVLPRLVSETRLVRAAFARPDHGDGLFEVQEELF